MPGDGSEGLLPEWMFELPDDRIARRPADRRDQSRLLHLPLNGRGHEDRVFSEIVGLLRPGDLLVANDSRVMAARLRGRRATGGAVELVCLEPGPGPILTLGRPARKLRVGEIIEVGRYRATILENAGDGELRVAFDADPAQIMAELGEMPLPPYLGRRADASDRERYQTVFARELGSAAAPTAGLHFDDTLLASLAEAGVGFATVTLHVGIGTFRVLRAEDLRRGALHEERWVVGEATAQAIARTRAAGGRVIAVGTTSCRTLESATPDGERVPVAGTGTTTLFVRPPYRFRCVDGLVTNFHLPGSSLLLLVGALAGRERLLDAYRHAVASGYRFYSYGDAMLLA